jgi:hypothetical protein
MTEETVIIKSHSNQFSFPKDLLVAKTNFFQEYFTTLKGKEQFFNFSYVKDEAVIYLLHYIQGKETPRIEDYNSAIFFAHFIGCTRMEEILEEEQESRREYDYWIEKLNKDKERTIAEADLDDLDDLEHLMKNNVDILKMVVQEKRNKLMFSYIFEDIDTKHLSSSQIIPFIKDYGAYSSSEVKRRFFNHIVKSMQQYYRENPEDLVVSILDKAKAENKCIDTDIAQQNIRQFCEDVIQGNSLIKYMIQDSEDEDEDSEDEDEDSEDEDIKKKKKKKEKRRVETKILKDLKKKFRCGRHSK